VYVVTFYSFKGGAGRSMSLINVAAELAKSGRKVLVVDFDLEAPGIGEFDLVKPVAPQKGIVEFVEDYKTSGEVPNVSSYVYESNKFDKSGGQLFVMPAGVLDSTYQDRFSAINWQKLYDEDNGYALMEDLRVQWDTQLQCDYVFIDSRTGYTDVGGICTRQLPDAVCLIFSPNRQNLTGLSHVVNDIRSQSDVVGLRHPHLHFVASNVPSLDEDGEVLTNSLARFKNALGYEKTCAVINHYNSFALLNEEVFTLRYPNTQLAKQYRALATKIAQFNLRDRISAIEFLREAIVDYPSAGKDYSAQEIDNLLVKILDFLGNDPDIVYLVSRVKRVSGDLEQARELLESAINIGCVLPRAYLDRAFFLDRDGSFSEAWDDVKRALNSVALASSSDVILAIRIGLRLAVPLGKEFSLDVFSSSRAIKQLTAEDFIFICSSIDDSRSGAEIVISLVESAFDWDGASADEKDSAKIVLANSYIAIGNLQKSIEIYRELEGGKFGTRLVIMFNLGLALFWSGKKEEARKYYSEGARLFSQDDQKDFNYVQCRSFVHFVLGEVEQANRLLDFIEESLLSYNLRRMFSCWRYYAVTSKQAEMDIKEMRNLYNGETVLPKFLEGSN
jgi:MinD-like ATPase involved in chromosome partitioning or flagellar assembly